MAGFALSLGEGGETLSVGVRGVFRCFPCLLLPAEFGMAPGCQQFKQAASYQPGPLWAKGCQI